MSKRFARRHARRISRRRILRCDLKVCGASTQTLRANNNASALLFTLSSRRFRFLSLEMINYRSCLFLVFCHFRQSCRHPALSPCLHLSLCLQIDFSRPTCLCQQNVFFQKICPRLKICSCLTSCSCRPACSLPGRRYRVFSAVCRTFPAPF